MGLVTTGSYPAAGQIAPKTPSIFPLSLSVSVDFIKVRITDNNKNKIEREERK